MVITDKETLTKPLSYFIKKGRSKSPDVTGGGGNAPGSPTAGPNGEGTGAVVVDPEKGVKPLLASDDAVSDASSDAPDRGTW